MNANGLIERHGLKFLASETQACALREAIVPFCNPDVHAPADGYRIHSLYFDTPQRDFYRANQLKQLVRIKPRVRTYGPSACPCPLPISPSADPHRLDFSPRRHEGAKGTASFGATLDHWSIHEPPLPILRAFVPSCLRGENPAFPRVR